VTLNEIVTAVTEFTREHEMCALPIIFFLAFGESLAFLSLLLPATVILLGLGGFIAGTFSYFFLVIICYGFHSN